MLLLNLNLLATAPGGVARLRELILTLAVQGKLVPQDSSDEPASELLKKIRAEKDRLIAAGKIKRDKPLAEIAEEKKPFGLPKGWAFCRLGELLLSIRSGGTPSKQNPDFWDGSIPWASVKDLSFGEPISDTQDRISQAGLDAGSELAPAGSILICTRMGLGKIGEALIDVAINQDLKAVLLGIGVNKQYFINYFKTLAVVGSGMTVAGIKQDELLRFIVPLPPTDEQSRIVTRVEELMRLCDSLETKGQLEAAQHAQLVSTLLGTLTDSDTPEQLTDNWHRIASHFDLLLDRPQAVDALEQTILQLAVRGLLVPQDPQDEPASELLKKIRAEKDRLIAQGKIKRDKPLPPIAEDEQPFVLPQGWEWAQMGDAVNSSEAGWSPTCIGSPRRGGHWGVLKVSAVSWGAFDANANKELPADLAPRPEYEVQDGDFLLSRANTEELVARSVVVGIAEPKLMLSDKIIRLDVSSLMNRDFLNLCNNANHARAHYIANASGTSSSMKNVSREVVLRAPVPLPPLAEQSRIVDRVTSLRRLCADLRARLAASQSTQVHLAEALVAI